MGVGLVGDIGGFFCVSLDLSKLLWFPFRWFLKPIIGDSIFCRMKSRTCVIYFHNQNPLSKPPLFIMYIGYVLFRVVNCGFYCTSCISRFRCV